MKYLTGLLSAIMMVATLATASIARAEDKKWTHVTIATEGAFRPWNFTKADGSLDGYEIELIKYLCDHMKVECTTVIQPFDGMIPALNAGKFDAIISGMSATAKREEVIAFSDSYGTTGQTFATLKDAPLVDLPMKGEVFSLATNAAGAAAEGAAWPVYAGRDRDHLPRRHEPGPCGADRAGAAVVGAGNRR